MQRRHHARIAGAFGLLFLLLWAGMQPHLYPRFVLLVVPVAAVACGLLLSSFRQKIVAAIAGACLVIMPVGGTALSWDNIRYVFTGDETEYHRFTWYFPVYKRVNEITPRDARMLVIVSSGHTYYLDRQYRRADPWLTGEVEWPSVNSAAALDSVLDRGGFSYVIYEDRDWSAFKGGAQMMQAIRDAVSKGSLAQVEVFDTRLYTNRMRRQFRDSRVLLLRRL